MKLLVIGDALSQYTVAFARFLKRHDPTVTIDIINTRFMKSTADIAEPICEVYDKIYRSRSVNNSILRTSKRPGRIARFRDRRVASQVNRVIGQYDVICLQGFWDRVMSMYNRLHHEHLFTVGVIWGSDFYRRNHSAGALSDIFDRCDRILVATDEMKLDVLRIYPLPLAKIRTCLFGLEPLETLIQMKGTSSAKAKQRLGLKADAFVITCGHNASQFQNHLAIVDQLAQVMPALPTGYVLIFPFTYGGDDAYISHVKDKLEKSVLNYRIIEDYMSDEQISLLRLATDMFIQVQTTDAFSGSMREHLFAKNIVITGSWLPYQTLARDRIYFETIKGLPFLGEKVSDVLARYPQVKQQIDSYNTPEKFEQHRWPEAIQSWHQVFLEYRCVRHEQEL